MARRYLYQRGDGQTRRTGEIDSHYEVFDGRTQMEVADEIGISQAQVSRLEKAALKHLRRYMVIHEAESINQ